MLDVCWMFVNLHKSMALLWLWPSCVFFYCWLLNVQFAQILGVHASIKINLFSGNFSQKYVLWNMIVYYVMLYVVCVWWLHLKAQVEILPLAWIKIVCDFSSIEEWSVASQERFVKMSLISSWNSPATVAFWIATNVLFLKSFHEIFSVLVTFALQVKLALSPISRLNLSEVKTTSTALIEIDKIHNIYKLLAIIEQSKIIQESYS